ncbi:MAG: 4-hydroxy-tetrahydrodipicolinate synthase [bacterium JZ-2024 1]
MFGNVLTAMITPFRENGELDEETAVKLAKDLVENGSEGLVVCGTTGESPTLTDEEKIRLIKKVKEAVGGKAKIIAGMGTYSTEHTIHLGREVERIGVDGIMVVAPYYNRPPQDALFLHFAAIADSIALPIVVYNIPSRTGVNVAPETIIRLAQIENIVGLKQANASLEETSVIRKNTPERFVIYSGDDSLTLPFLSVGATGVVSVASHLVGKRIAQMIQSFFSGNVREALSIHLELFPLYKILFMVTNPIPVKAALYLKGKIPCDYLRPPLRSPTVEEREKIRKVLEEGKWL